MAKDQVSAVNDDDALDDFELPEAINVVTRTSPEQLLGMEIVILAMGEDSESKFKGSVSVKYREITGPRSAGPVDYFYTTSEVLKEQLALAAQNQGFPVRGIIKAGMSRSGQNYYTFSA